jgi:hypothetical protein
MMITAAPRIAERTRLYASPGSVAAVPLRSSRAGCGRAAAIARRAAARFWLSDSHRWGSRIDLVAGYCFERIVSNESVSSGLLLLARWRHRGPRGWVTEGATSEMPGPAAKTAEA